MKSAPAPARRRKTWKTLAAGIYENAITHGRRGVVNIAAGRKEKRFPPDTPVIEIRRWRNETKTKLERLHPTRRAGAIGRGTFSAGVKSHIKTLAISSWRSRRSELKAWEKEFGKVHRSRVTSDHIKRAIKKWVDAGVPPKTILNRVRALTAMYHERDGKDAWTPADDVRLPKLSKTRKPFVAAQFIIDVEQRLREQTAAGTLEDGEQWRGRFMVLTACGARPVFLKRAQPADVDLERRVWGMASAKDGEPVELFLNDEMLAAWEVFIAADAWGDFDASEYARMVRAAGWPAHLKPYASKHTVGRELGERGVDLQTIADWFGHSDAKTTRENYVPVLNSQIRRASELLNGRLPWTPKSGRSLAIDVGKSSEEERNDQILKILEEIRCSLKPGS